MNKILLLLLFTFGSAMAQSDNSLANTFDRSSNILKINNVEYKAEGNDYRRSLYDYFWPLYGNTHNNSSPTRIHLPLNNTFGQLNSDDLVWINNRFVSFTRNGNSWRGIRYSASPPVGRNMSLPVRVYRFHFVSLPEGWPQ